MKNLSLKNSVKVVGYFAFTGQEIDIDTGLYYYGARYYNPHSGRFISADSVIDGVKNPQGYNRYSYVQNNPITYNDPTGHWSVGLGVTIGYTKSGGWSVGVGASWDIGTGPSANLGATYRVGHLDSARDLKDLKYDRSNLSLNTGVTLYYFGFYTGWSLGYDFGSGQATTSTNAGYEIFGFGSGTTLTWGFDTRNDWNPSFTIGQDFFAGGQGGISVGPSVTWTKGEERTRQINFGAFGAHATYSPDAEEGNQWDYGFSTTTTVGYDSEKGGMQKPSNSTIESVGAASQHIQDMKNGWDEKNWGPKPTEEQRKLNKMINEILSGAEYNDYYLEGMEIATLTPEAKLYLLSVAPGAACSQGACELRNEWIDPDINTDQYKRASTLKESNEISYYKDEKGNNTTDSQKLAEQLNPGDVIIYAPVGDTDFSGHTATVLKKDKHTITYVDYHRKTNPTVMRVEYSKLNKYEDTKIYGGGKWAR